jgi:hypothetical protein
MNHLFGRSTWGLTVPAPWRAEEVEGCVEITQPEGLGAVHISDGHKKEGHVQEHETLSQLRTKMSDDSDVERAVLGDFIGYSGEETDWRSDRFWKRWFLGCRDTLLFVTYTCKRGDQESELPAVATLLSSLRSRK